ncbi:64_t:CDS:2, partial [Dentiscutata heterogama]
SDGHTRIWCQVNEKYYRECINSTVKFGGGSVMFWGCFCWWGVELLVEIKEWWMKSHSFNILDWAPHSPDLNPIENLWECLDSAVHYFAFHEYANREKLRARAVFSYKREAFVYSNGNDFFDLVAVPFKGCVIRL